mmetsp:Transcript_85087/g.216735  ORF Transcript_85087/g.216735 Transcript_85087/m.216735 type:complete len:260 (+) Transcript_85087:66-845(+)
MINGVIERIPGCLRRCQRRRSSSSAADREALSSSILSHDGQASLASVPEDEELGQDDDDPSQFTTLPPCDCTFCRGAKGAPFISDLPGTVSRKVFAACLELLDAHANSAARGDKGLPGRVLVVGNLADAERAATTACGEVDMDITPHADLLDVLDRSTHPLLCTGYIQGDGFCAVEGHSGQIVTLSRSFALSLDVDSHLDARSRLANFVASSCDCVVLLASKDSQAVIILRGRRGEVHRHNYKSVLEGNLGDAKACTTM